MYRSAADAEVARAALERADIGAFVSGVEIVQVNWFRWVRGVRLRVAREDYFRAADIIDSQCRGLDEILEADEPIRDPDACPKCGSPEIVRRERARTFALLTVLIVAVGAAIGMLDVVFLAIAVTAIYLLVAGRWRCTACGHSWT